MSKRYDYDLIVLGSGSGGNVAAHRARSQGYDVALFEPNEIGGECPNWGCVPTKALLHAARLYRHAKAAGHYGIETAEIEVNYPKVKAWKDLAVSRTGTTHGQELLEEDGIDVIRAAARLIDPHTVTADRNHYQARKILLATGTSPFVPPIAGLKEAGFITHKEAINLQQPPESVFIIGGGPIGSEFAQLFNDFGVEVNIGEMQPQLIPLEDGEIGELVGAIFKDRGIEVLTSAKITQVSQQNGQKIVHYTLNGQQHTKAVEEVLIAAGMRPNTDIGLENAGVEYSKRGITVNKQMQTTTKNIYAAGDVVGPYQFTHMASYQSRIAVHNMFHRKGKRKVDYQAVPRCVFTSPEVAATGLTETEAQDKLDSVKIGASPIEILGRANTADDFLGFVKVIANVDGEIVGASMVAPRAGELIHELTLAIKLGATAKQVGRTIHAFPTYSEAVRNACLQVK